MTKTEEHNRKVQQRRTSYLLLYTTKKMQGLSVSNGAPDKLKVDPDWKRQFKQWGYVPE